MVYPVVMIAGVQSGVGKTTVAMGLMAALRKRGMDVQPFKVGPDYIDPGLHGYVTGNASHNLDSWMGSEQVVSAIFKKHASIADISIVEGVMGLFDGARNAGMVGSSAHIAKLLNIPVILVVNVKGMGPSCLALIKGFAEYEPGVDICGVILNNAGSKYYRTFIKGEIEQRLGIPVLGCLSRDSDIVMPERHLGLLPQEENTQLITAVEGMRGQVEQDIDLERLLHIVYQRNERQNTDGHKRPYHLETAQVPKISAEGKDYLLRIGVAKDEAFSFYYQDNFDYLDEQLIQVKFFSPLHDECLPDVDGLYFGGGFPEGYLHGLTENQPMIASIRKAAVNGMPIYAECGGMMYLAERIHDFQGKEWSGVGLVPYHIEMTKSLVGLGYVQVTALQDNLIARRGETLRGHEFHYSRVRSAFGDGTKSIKSDENVFAVTGGKGVDGRKEGFGNSNILASYIHIHFRSNTSTVERFKEHCLLYREGKDKRLTNDGQKSASMKQYVSLPKGHGYTTGTCAAAATRAAMELLVCRKYVHQVGIQLPNGIEVAIPIEFVRHEGSGVRAAVIKDAGDDPDVTHNTEIQVHVEFITGEDVHEVWVDGQNFEGNNRIVIAGGEGVGIVTKPGLSVPVGEPAINPVPREMIRLQAAELLPVGKGLKVTVSVPKGTELAAKTLNPKLGIVGGISIIGTSGVVRPMSDEAYLNSLIPQIDQAVSLGERILILTPGGMGERMAAERGIRKEAIVQMSNFVGAIAVDCARRPEVDGIVLYGHIGKLIKVAAGIFHTHSRMADARRETLAAYAALAGAPKQAIESIMQLNTVDAGIEIIAEYRLHSVYRQLAEAVSRRMGEYVQAHIAREIPVDKSGQQDCNYPDRANMPIAVGTVLYALNGDILGYDATAKKLLQPFQWLREDAN